jgi:hypothetical protein
MGHTNARAQIAQPTAITRYARPLSVGMPHQPALLATTTRSSIRMPPT